MRVVRLASGVAVLLTALDAVTVVAQSITPPRLAILQAEERRGRTAQDLATLRNALRSPDEHSARLAVRALGRLERAELIPAMLPALDHRSPAVRAEAANAVAQASRPTGGKPVGTKSRVAPGDLLRMLIERVQDEPDPTVRASLAESIGRLPFDDEDSAAAAQRALVTLATSPDAGLTDRLSVAKAFEVYARVHRESPLGGPALDVLRGLVRSLARSTGSASAENGGSLSVPTKADLDPQRGARVRRLALEALIRSNAADNETLATAAEDMDAQTRALAMRGARPEWLDLLMRGLSDPAAQVRVEAVRRLAEAVGDGACGPLVTAAADAHLQVSLAALDELKACGHSEDAVQQLTQWVTVGLATGRPAHEWHRPAHALVALAAASPGQASSLIERVREADRPQMRAYAARAAALAMDLATLERLAADADDNVVEAALDGLASHASKPRVPELAARALTRPGYQVVRAAARALGRSDPREGSVQALRTALERLTAENRANSTDARTAVRAALTALGAQPDVDAKGEADTRPTSRLTVEELRRVSSARARITMQGGKSFDVALIAQEAPVTVVQFVHLASSGYYRGLTFHRVAPNFVIQGGSPGANEYVGHPDHMRDEVGTWPHVRGAVGISTRGRDTGDAQFFINLVDNPRLDHEYTVFGYVVAGMDVVDGVLEGDVMEKVEILDLR